MNLYLLANERIDIRPVRDIIEEVVENGLTRPFSGRAGYTMVVRTEKAFGSIMSSSRLFVILLVSLTGCAPSYTKISDDPTTPSVAVMIEGGGLRLDDFNQYPKIFLVAWPDGKIVWSKNQTEGGPPFFVGTIDAKQIAELLNEFDSRMVFDKSSNRHSWYGPDSNYHSIWLRNRDVYTRLETWHELFEENPNLVAINGGITSLDGKTRDDMIRADKSEFSEFRKLWQDLRERTAELVPASGMPYDEPLKLDLPR